MTIFIYHDADNDTILAFDSFEKAKAQAEEDWPDAVEAWTYDKDRGGLGEWAYGEYVAVYEREVQ